MNASVNTDLKIPDLWFDFYARILPGSAFVAVAVYYVIGLETSPSALEALLAVFAGYFIAMLTQPFASRMTRRVERFADWLRKLNEDHVLQAQQALGRDTRRALLLSKMHGESTFFVQIALLSLGLYFIAHLVGGSRWWLGYWPIVSCLINLGFALEVADRRLMKASRYLRTLNGSAEADTNGKA